MKKAMKMLDRCFGVIFVYFASFLNLIRFGLNWFSFWMIKKMVNYVCMRTPMEWTQNWNSPLRVCKSGEKEATWILISWLLLLLQQGAESRISWAQPASKVKDTGHLIKIKEIGHPLKLGIFEIRPTTICPCPHVKWKRGCEYWR